MGNSLIGRIRLMEISQLRREYSNLTLRRKNLLDNPFDQFRLWFAEAMSSGLLEVNAMQLATTDGVKPSIRTVLLKGVENDGFVFFSNYQSRKAQDLKRNSHAAILFLYKEMERQITIEGTVEKVSHEESEAYFATRPRTSQIGAWASTQGHPIASREELEKKFQELNQKYTGKKIPKPDYWGGYKLKPDRFEFWQGRPFRLHDRFQYILDHDTWKIERLSP